jgi:hypothetical protein
MERAGGVPDAPGLEHDNVDSVATQLERGGESTVAGADDSDVDAIGKRSRRLIGGRRPLPPVRRGREAGSGDVDQVDLRDASP